MWTTQRRSARVATGAQQIDHHPSVVLVSPGSVSELGEGLTRQSVPWIGVTFKLDR